MPFSIGTRWEPGLKIPTARRQRIAGPSHFARLLADLFGGVEKRQSLACVHKALDLGINFFDTANVYGRGAAESVLSEALSGIPRHSYSLATKVFFPMSDTDRGLSRAQIVKQLDASLKRLRTDYVDLYQCHRFDEEDIP